MEKKPLNKVRTKPDWLKIKLPTGKTYMNVRDIVKRHKLHTICTSGNCPNMGECWGRGTATFMILGDICTRSCKFCATKSGKPEPADWDEPARLAESVKLMGLKHCVITSVDRDDLEDGGAEIWALTIRKIKEVNPHITIEALIPDFNGDTDLLDIVIAAQPEVLSHNLETVERLTRTARSKARYDVSLKVLAHIAQSPVVAKSGIMVGLGETEDEVLHLMDDLRATGCEILTIGQYLQPTHKHLPVEEYVHPDQFKKYEIAGLKKGFRFVESDPLVRSSYHAEKHIQPPTQKQTVHVQDLGEIDYEAAWDLQETTLQKLIANKLNNQHLPPAQQHAQEHQLLFCEHPHVYTLGKSGSEDNLLVNAIQLQAKHATFVKTNRGGDITYHGPGQIVGYPIFDLEAFSIGVKAYVHLLEQAIIETLKVYGIEGHRMEGATGVWLDPDLPGKARKICAIGVRVSRYVSMHGFAFNVNTDLNYFNYINPCGFTDKAVTSLEKELGEPQDFEAVKQQVQNKIMEQFKASIV